MEAKFAFAFIVSGIIIHGLLLWFLGEKLLDTWGEENNTAWYVSFSWVAIVDLAQLQYHAMIKIPKVTRSTKKKNIKKWMKIFANDFI